MSARLFQYVKRNSTATGCRQFTTSQLASARATDHLSKKGRADARQNTVAARQSNQKTPKLNRFAPKKSSNWSIYSFEKTVKNSRDAPAPGERSPYRPVEPVRSDSLLNGAVKFGANAEAGNLTIYSESTMKFLKSHGAIPAKQYLNLFSEGATVVRKATIELEGVLSEVKETKETAQSIILTGDSGSGKTIVLQQVVALAKKHDYLVIHISDVEDLIDGTNDYRLDEETKLYDQPMYAKRLLRKIIDANQLKTAKKGLFFETKLTSSYSFKEGRSGTKTLAAGKASLAELILTGGANNLNSITGLKGLFAELDAAKYVCFCF